MAQVIPVWQIDARRYLYVHNIHEPYICEISPYQYHLMGKHARAQYDRERAGQWQASSDGKDAWKREVIDAYDAGEFTLTDPLLNKDAAMCVRYTLKARKQAAKETELRAAYTNSKFTSPSQIAVGDMVWEPIAHRYCEVLKVNTKTARLAGSYGPTVTPIQMLSRKSPADIKAERDVYGDNE